MPALRRRLGLAETIPRTKPIYQNGKKGQFYIIVFLIQSQIIMLINKVWLFNFDSTKHRR
jgi:hypothetical protein